MELRSLLASLKANTACKELQRQEQPPWTVHSTFLDFPRWVGFYPAILRMHPVFLAKNWKKISLKKDWLQGPSGECSNRSDQAPRLLASHFQLNCTQHSGEEWKDTARYADEHSAIWLQLCCKKKLFILPWWGMIYVSRTLTYGVLWKHPLILNVSNHLFFHWCLKCHH